MEKKYDLRLATTRYHHKPDATSAMKYVDPFAYPSFFQPTYESRHPEARLNPSKKIGGFSLAELSSLNDLYALMPYQDYLRNTYLSFMAMDFRNRPENQSIDLFQCKIVSCFQLKGKHGKTYTYRKTSIENGMADGKISHSVAFWEDISDLNIRNINFWSFESRNSAYCDFDIPEVSLFQNILSQKEVQVIRLLARGFSSQDIATALKISRHTVDTHRRNMLRKLEAANTVELVELARSMNLV